MASLIFFGTYTERRGQGIYSAWLDTETGNLSAPKLAALTANPTFLALSGDGQFLFAVSQAPGMAVSFRINALDGTLTALQKPEAPAGRAPCHLALDRTGSILLATNYHQGIVGAIPVGAGGSLGIPRVVKHEGRSIDPVRQTSSHVHSSAVSADNRFAIICDLGLDKLFTYRLDMEADALRPASPPFVTVQPGSGPRHFTFGATEEKAYVINELANTVIGFDYDRDTGALRAFQTASSLPEGFSGKSIAAEIRLHPNRRFLYVSNRGHDSLACFSVDPVSGRISLAATTACGGKSPRHFSLTSDGRFLVCSHQDSDSACVFSVDPASGGLTDTGQRISVPEPVCVAIREQA